MYFMSKNHNENKLLRISPPEKKKKAQAWTSSYGYGNSAKEKEEEPEVADDDAYFTVTEDPTQLEKIDMIWTLARECKHPDVINKAIGFLVNCHLSINEDIQDRRIPIMQSFISQCFELITASQGNPEKV